MNSLPISNTFESIRAEIVSICTRLIEVGSHETQDRVRLLLDSLHAPFALFCCGEFNAGKSSLVNALLGEPRASVGVLPTTHLIEQYSWNNFILLDSPGTNSLLKEHQVTTERYLERCDAVLFVTSVERPFSESEREFLVLVRETWKRKLIVVVNKSDLRTDAENQEIGRYVAEQFQRLFGESPPIVFVSTVRGTGLKELQDVFQSVLHEGARLKEKLSAPLNALAVLLREEAQRVVEDQGKLESEREGFLRVIRRVQRKVQSVPGIFQGFGAQSRALFQDFSHELSDLVDRNFRIWTFLRTKFFGVSEKYKLKIHEILERLRFETRLNEVLKAVATQIATLRDVLLEEAEEELARTESFAGQPPDFRLPERRLVNPDELTESLKASAERGLVKFLTFGSGAVASGVGAKITTVAPLEVTGLLLMISLGVLSFRVLPVERRKLKKELEDSFREVAERFESSLFEGIAEALASSTKVVEEALSPRLTEIQEALRAAELRNDSLRAIEAARADLADRVEKF